METDIFHKKIIIKLCAGVADAAWSPAVCGIFFIFPLDSRSNKHNENERARKNESKSF